MNTEFKKWLADKDLTDLNGIGVLDLYEKFQKEMGND